MAALPGSGRASGLGWVIRFIRCRRAAATALGAAFMSLMSLGGFALTSDHTSLVHQRDTLKAATDAASFATSRHWRQALSSSLTDDQIKAALLPIAERYILANIPAGRRAGVESTLEVQLTLHHRAGMVDVDATADLSGGVLFSGWLLDADTAAGMGDVTVETRTERLEADGGTIEVALAIDDTRSMRVTLSGRECFSERRRVPHHYREAGGQGPHRYPGRRERFRSSRGRSLELHGENGRRYEHTMER